MRWYADLGLAGQTLVNYILKVRKGEDVLIYGDGANDEAPPKLKMAFCPLTETYGLQTKSRTT